MFADFIRSFRNKRIEVPRKIQFFQEITPSPECKKCENRVIASSSDIDDMTLHFVDDFRKMVDLSIRQLEKDDPDFDEFGKDPKTPLLNYIDNIIKHTQIEWTTLPGSIALLNRLLKMNKNAKISINNMHRLMVAALVISDKFLEDVPASIEDFARGSGFELVLFLFGLVLITLGLFMRN